MPIYPHPENRCAIPADKAKVIEVYLTSRCNASCEWCFDKKAYHTSKKTDYKALAEKILLFPQQTVLLTGGEPTLYKDLKPLISLLCDNGRSIDITTNGSTLNEKFVDKLANVKCVTISIHHFDLHKNFKITKIKLDESKLINSIKKLHESNVEVRINCTVSLGYLETREDIDNFIEFGKRLGADSIRFAEVSYYDKSFVNLNKIFEGQYGLTEEPFVNGCYKSTVINGMPVDIKLSCGALTCNRKVPEGATWENYKNIIYYDGESYRGWQSSYNNYEEKTVDNILDDLLDSKISKENAVRYLSL